MSENRSGELTFDAEDLADYTDDHQTKPPPQPSEVRRAHTPDVADPPSAEPPD